MPISWIQSLRLWNAGMSSWTIPRKETPQFEALNRLRQGDMVVSIPEDKPKKITKIDNAKKYGIDDEDTKASLRKWISSLSGKIGISKATTGIFETDDYFRVDFNVNKQPKLEIPFPPLPVRNHKVGKWFVIGTFEGNNVVFEIRTNTVENVYVQKKSHSFINSMKQALNGSLKYEMHVF